MAFPLVSVTPIARAWPHAPTELTRGIRIIESPTFKRPDWHFWNLRRTEEQKLLERSHWLCLERECEWADDLSPKKKTCDLRTAMLGVQLWAPVGWDGLILDCRRISDGSLDIESVHQLESYAVPRWGRGIELRKLDPTQLGLLIEGTLVATESGSVPLVNPFEFLEIGLQTAINHERAGAALLIMGLDGLLAAEGMATFARRLRKLLGPDTKVFPPDWAGRHPSYSVSELAADMFEFRSLIAHGKEILWKYREPKPIQLQNTVLGPRLDLEWSRGTLMIESIVFVLIAALKKIITERLMERIKDQRTWKRWLDSPI